MLLTIDIGNTNITLGVFKYAQGKPVKGPANIWRLHTNVKMTEDEYGTKILDLLQYAFIETAGIKAVAVASVVPALNRTFEEMTLKYFKQAAFFVGREALPKIDVLYENPEEVGADRIANAVAAYAYYGGPVIVLDFGTATTFDCISKKGVYLGGAIAPGPGISAEALAKFTSKLPRVEMKKPEKAIGKSTIRAMQSGLYYGYIGLIKEILQRTKKEIVGTPVVIATGGLAGLIVPEIKEVKAIVPELTLEGIRIIWEKVSC
jgi:type III pantothenate kinase